jgi:hypothetical protein
MGADGRLCEQHSYGTGEKMQRGFLWSRMASGSSVSLTASEARTAGPGQGLTLPVHLTGDLTWLRGLKHPNSLSGFNTRRK